MTNQHESFPDLMHEDSFEVVMRGYSRRQVHDYMNRTRNQIRDLEERLVRSIDQAEQSRMELADARRRLSDAPQDYDELGERLSQILKLGEEEAASKRQVADAEANKLRDDAAAEAERLVTSAQERGEGILNAAQQEAERRVAEATHASEQMLAQAGGDAEETINAARAESDETLRAARAESDRMLTSARNESERTIESARAEAESTLNSARAEAESTVTSANAEAHATLTSAQQRATILDETTGRRVSYLTDTHHEVMRRLNEMGAVLGDLIQREGSAGPLIDEASVLPPAPVQAALPAAEAEVDFVSEADPDGGFSGDDFFTPRTDFAPGSEGQGASRAEALLDVEAVRVIVDEDEEHDGVFGGGRRAQGFDETDANAGRAGKENDEYASRK
ncbi:hypothetical protein AB0395_36745 [Streptosporangium sp. NPDC051023]|uniref:hypothetical protein n=1 Tax=Streptosporangium sp. NPDC051023 TaxID=3155410 RepID=UPI00344BC95D